MSQKITAGTAGVNTEFPKDKRNGSRRGKQKGFSLIELMVVIAIIGILGAFIVPKIFDKPDKARVAKAKNDVAALESALTMYKMDNFSFPTTDQGLDALVSKPSGSPEPRNWNENGYVNRLPKDPWGNDYQYLSPGTNGDIDIYSLGADGQEGGDGLNADIGNWNLDEI